jgi:hypothetical protein
MLQGSKIKLISEHLGMLAEALRMHQARRPLVIEFWPWQSDTDEHQSDVNAADQDQSVCW